MDPNDYQSVVSQSTDLVHSLLPWFLGCFFLLLLVSFFRVFCRLYLSDWNTSPTTASCSEPRPVPELSLAEKARLQAEKEYDSWLLPLPELVDLTEKRF